jgi:PAS domain S-box-containing protein
MEDTNGIIQLDFEQAKAKHLLFKSKLRSILYGAQLIDEAPVLSHYECTVGKWIYNHALKAYGHIPEMQELEKIHADIHTSARELVALYKDGKEEEARRGLTGMEKIADHLVGLLAIVEHKLAIEPPRISIQYEGLEASRTELNDLLLANDALDKRIQQQSGELITERQLLHNFFMQAPASFSILKGPQHIYELANEGYSQITGKKNLIGKTVREVFPEIEGQGFFDILDTVYKTGESFISKEAFVQIDKNDDGKLHPIYVNYIIQPYKNLEGETEGLITFGYEVTEQVIARKKIEESEEQLRIAIEGGDLGTYDYYPQTGELTWSAKTKELFGLPPNAEVNYDTFLKGLHPEDKERVYAANQKALKIESGGIYDNEYRTIGLTDGKVRWVKSKGITSFDKDDKPIRFTGVAQDITEEEAAKEAVAYRNALLEAQNEAIPDAILIVDTKGKMISFNHHFVELWKIPEDIIIRKDDAAALQYAMTQLIDPQGFIERVNYYYAHPDEKANEEVLFKDGRIIQRYGNVVIGEDGTRYGWAWYFRDITASRKNEIEIKQSEERFRTLANSVSHLAWMANPDGWIYWYNQRWYDYTDTTLEEMQGWGWDKVHHPEHIKRVIEYVKVAWQNDEPYELTFPLKRYDGVYRWFLTRVYPVKNKEGKVIQWIGTNTDIDDQKKASEQKDEFISIASHELKTPVTSLKGFTQILQMTFEKEGNKNAVNLLSKMDKQVDKLTNLIVDLLDTTKIENGQLKFNLEVFDFNNLVKEIAEEMRRTTITHEIIVEESDNANINGDRNRIGQVITNFISNAIKYSPDKSKIIITTTVEEQNVKLCVKDFGIGIASEKQSNIFDRFFRVTGDGQETFPGLGLGLFISKEIIKRHNGKIYVESAEGEGSKFCFLLPVSI